MNNYNINFGAQYPTRNILILASGCRMDGANKTAFATNVSTIQALTNNKINLFNTCSTACGMIFDKVGAMLKEQFPQLIPFIEMIEKTPFKPSDKAYCKDIDNIIQSAEKELGQNLNVSTEQIEQCVIRLVG